MSLDRSHRRRRSSFSEQIQRMLSKDRSDNREREKEETDIDQPLSSQTQFKDVSVSRGSHDKFELVTGHDVPEYFLNETGPNSDINRSTSRMPSIGTPDSSPSVHPTIPKDEDVTEAEENRRIDEICTSPTWEQWEKKEKKSKKEKSEKKETRRSERRATKRLEAERKELEKRLIQLEESQTQLDKGERKSNRLTKKKNYGSLSRDSSVGTEKRRRSSSLSDFFSRSRRGSRSSSVAGDSETEISQSHASEKGPPALSLALPERFGAAVTRELATKHVNNIMTAPHQVQPPLPPSSPVARSIHSTLKSDDLRENWKMAQAWQRKRNSSGAASDTSHVPEMQLNGQPVAEQDDSKSDSKSYIESDDPKRDIDSEIFTAAVKRARTPAKTGSSEARIPVSSYGSQNSSSRSSAAFSTNSQMQDGNKPIRHSIAGDIPIAALWGHSTATKDNKPIPRPKPYPNNSAPKLMQTKAYKSSPLAMNPNRTEPQTASIPLCSYESIIPQSVRFTQQPVRSSSNPVAATQPSSAIRENHYKGPAIPLRHPGHPSSEDAKARVETAASRTSTLTRPIAGSPGATQSQSGSKPEHKRGLSGSSEGSSYDTADEELHAPAAIDAPKKQEPVQLGPQTPGPKANRTLPQNEVQGVPSKPSPALGGALGLWRRKTRQKLKPMQINQIIGKVFVICCQCKYWHDLPSEVYAKLAIPEHVLSDSRLGRAFSRRNSVRKSILPADPSESRRVPVPRRLQFSDQPEIIPKSAPKGPTSDEPPTSAIPRPQCCWCGHGMSKVCCQGWTTTVQMRERHH